MKQDSEEVMVMGLNYIKALGDAMVNLGSPDASLCKGTISNLGHLIIDKADEVYAAVVGGLK